MIEKTIHDALLVFVFVLAPITFVALFFRKAPYGRHGGEPFGPTMPVRAGWMLMESPPVIAFAAFFLRGERALSLAPLVLFAMWQAHYLQRAIVYPLTMRVKPGDSMPVAIALLGFSFNVINAYLNASAISGMGRVYEASWLLDPRFVGGALLFVAGYAINRWADAVLRGLRRPGESGYRIPRGGLYERISCPNYFGETIEWIGWAVATWSLEGLSFAVYTVANLLPRAIAHHRWYREKFPDYPRERRAFFPYLL